MENFGSDPVVMPRVAGTDVVEAIADESQRSVSIVAALQNGNVPLDALTVRALDHVARHLDAALYAAESADGR